MLTNNDVIQVIRERYVPCWCPAIQKIKLEEPGLLVEEITDEGAGVSCQSVITFKLDCREHLGTGGCIFRSGQPKYFDISQLT